jgi:hypothetical protein
MERENDWIASSEAVRLLKTAFSTYEAQMTICRRAHGGLIRARAQRFIFDGTKRDNFEIPKEFWWAEGHAALTQNWTAGDFETWTHDHQSLLQAFGVSFFRADIDKIAPAAPSPSISPGASAEPSRSTLIKTESERGYAFVAMAMHHSDHQLVDVLETIKSAATECGITAERIDDDQKNERITGRVLDNIRKAEFVIVDLTHERPSVYYEAGYAERDGKAPIFVARMGTVIHFDVQDFPIIFFNNMKELREGLIKRFRAIGRLGQE